MMQANMMSRSSSMNGQAVQNFQMQSLLQMKNQMDQNPDYFNSESAMAGAQGNQQQMINAHMMRQMAQLASQA